MRVIYTSKEMSKNVWGARYTLGARYLSKKYGIKKKEPVITGLLFRSNVDALTFSVCQVEQ